MSSLIDMKGKYGGHRSGIQSQGSQGRMSGITGHGVTGQGVTVPRCSH